MNTIHKIKVEYGTVQVERTTNYVSLLVRDNANDAHVLLTDDMVLDIISALAESAGRICELRRYDDERDG